jgi:hypothetical protein
LAGLIFDEAGGAFQFRKARCERGSRAVTTGHPRRMHCESP